MLSIGQLSKTTGVKVPTIRYYEKIGLLPEPGRSEGNQRVYPDSAADRLAFIFHSRSLGFSLDAVRDLLQLADHPDQSCAAVDEIARHQLEAVKQRIAQLSLLRDELERMLEHCEMETVSDCRVIQVLSDHSKCAHEHKLESTTLAATEDAKAKPHEH
ncbi:MerR family transcriptional regulator [Marinobacterium lutimaris]|uniref:DNA-binding transcriptional regulator, MerR family n=1 Tax=Marinobacterium lutimaris TaxID=568106 RepID=A0A1H5VNB4_9GAMM|nr:helix-turn-helix domain-containing protein [Marinobacterium lutimaris]SEF88683.1 DNA-binding transcriptional regulator, MerR family [Marinobacterium lutimaris]